MGEKKDWVLSDLNDELRDLDRMIEIEHANLNKMRRRRASLVTKISDREQYLRRSTIVIPPRFLTM